MTITKCRSRFEGLDHRLILVGHFFIKLGFTVAAGLGQEVAHRDGLVGVFRCLPPFQSAPPCWRARHPAAHHPARHPGRPHDPAAALGLGAARRARAGQLAAAAAPPHRVLTRPAGPPHDHSASLAGSGGRGGESDMRRGRFAMLGLAAALLVPVAAPAGAGSNLTGNDLLDRSASASANPIQWGVCLGYVWPTAMRGPGRPIHGVRACPAADVTSGQMMDVVRQWLERNPARRNLAGSILVAAALQQAFPCK